MSHAFIRESDDHSLDQVSPTLPALLNYLTRENNGIPAREKRRYTDPETGRMVYEMSSGLAFSIGEDGKWFMLD